MSIIYIDSYRFGVSGPSDPYFNNVSLLLHGDGTNGSTTIVDSSSNNSAITTVGDAQISTSVKKFGTGSLAFDGTGDGVTGPFNQWLALGTTDFTVEMWVYFNVVKISVFFGNIDDSGFGDWAFIYNSSVSQLRLLLNNLAVVLSSSSWTPSSSTWYHIAVTRSSGTLRFFVDGILTGSGSNSTNITWSSPNQFFVGMSNTGGLGHNGYIDDLRITKGVARYTSNFTPPTAPFPNS